MGTCEHTKKNKKQNKTNKPAARSRGTKWGVKEMTHARGINKNQSNKKKKKGIKHYDNNNSNVSNPLIEYP